MKKAEAAEVSAAGAPTSGVMRRAKALVPLPLVDVDAEEGERRARRAQERARLDEIIVRARAELGVEARLEEATLWPMLRPFAYGGVRVVGFGVTGAGPGWVVAGVTPPRGTVHAEQLARELGWCDANGLNPDYRKLYRYAQLGLLTAFVCQTTRQRFYLVRDRERLLAADSIRRLGGKLPTALAGAQDNDQGTKGDTIT